MKYTAVYMRVSTDTQSTDSQELELRKYLQSQGLDPDDYTKVLWFTDVCSGDKFTPKDRAALEKLRENVKLGVIDQIIVWKLDRLARSIRDGIVILCEWLDAGVGVVSVTQQFDFRGPLGKAVAALLLSLAEMELQNIRERIRAGIARAQARGVKMGGNRGYRTTMAQVEMCLNMYNNGYPITHIAKAAGVGRTYIYRLCRKRGNPELRKQMQAARKAARQATRLERAKNSLDALEFASEALDRRKKCSTRKT